MRIPDDYLIKQDDSSPITEDDWKIVQSIPVMYPSSKVATSISRVNSIACPPTDVPLSQMMGRSMHNIFRAQVDTAIETTVAPHQHLLHCYWSYIYTFRSPISLVAALDFNAKVSPLGEGFLCIPSEDEHGLSSFVGV